MKKIHLLILIFSILSINLFAQNMVTTCVSDTIKLKAGNLQFGTLEWEKSFDNTNWTKIPNAQDSIYKFKPIESAYYRAVNKFPYCEPNYSTVTFVQKKPTAYAGTDKLVNDSYTTLLEILCRMELLRGQY